MQQPPPETPPQGHILEYAGPQLATAVNLRAVALAHRRIILIFPGIIIFMISFVVVMMSLDDPLRAIPPATRMTLELAVLAFQLMAAAVMMVGVYRSARALGCGTVESAMYMVVLLIPIVNLMVLWVIKLHATETLERGGIRIGLLGAKLSDLPAE